MNLSAKIVRKTFIYDPATGVLCWRNCAAKRIKPGTVAGKINKNGYRHVKFQQKWYYAHRLIWIYVTGKQPKAQVDHLNGKKADNRWANLREATISQNGWNGPIRSNNKSGFKWVFQKGKRFYAAIRDGRRQVRFGPFKSGEDAYVAAVAFARAKHGEFVRVK